MFNHSVALSRIVWVWKLFWFFVDKQRFHAVGFSLLVLLNYLLGANFVCFLKKWWWMHWLRFNSMAFKLESWFRLMNFINTLASWMYFFTVRPNIFFLNFLRIFISKCLKKIKFCICSYIKTPIPKFTKFCI